MKKYLYIMLHIPKTGGTSFKVTVQERNKFNENPTNVNVRHDNTMKTHEKYNSDNTEFRYITFIRHPIDRSLSHFKMNTESNNVFFESWFEPRWHNFTTKFLVKNLLCKNINVNNYEPTEEDIENIKLTLKKRMWKVVLTEDLDEELPKLLNEIGVEPIKQYHHTNKTKKFYELNSKEKQLILDKSKFDLEIYEYIKSIKLEEKQNGNDRKNNEESSIKRPEQPTA